MPSKNRFEGCNHALECTSQVSRFLLAFLQLQGITKHGRPAQSINVQAMLFSQRLCADRNVCALFVFVCCWRCPSSAMVTHRHERVCQGCQAVDTACWLLAAAQPEKRVYAGGCCQCCCQHCWRYSSRQGGEWVYLWLWRRSPRNQCSHYLWLAFKVSECLVQG